MIYTIYCSAALIKHKITSIRAMIYTIYCFAALIKHKITSIRAMIYTIYCSAALIKHKITSIRAMIYTIYCSAALIKHKITSIRAMIYTIYCSAALIKRHALEGKPHFVCRMRNTQQVKSYLTISVWQAGAPAQRTLTLEYGVLKSFNTNFSTMWSPHVIYSANIEKSKTWSFVHAMRVEQRGRTERSEVPNAILKN